MRPVLVIGVVSTLACGGSPVQPSPALPIGEPFEVQFGATVTLSDGARVRFVDVLSDSRCPVDAVCVSAGRAVVQVFVYGPEWSPQASPLSLQVLRIFINGLTDPPCVMSGTAFDCVLATSSQNAEADAGEYKVSLRQLAPYPRAATPIDPKDYLATLVVAPR